VRYYRQFVYEQGSLERAGGARPDEKIVNSAKKKDFEIGKLDRFRNRTRYFTDSGIIGTKGFVLRCYESAMEAAGLTREKRPVAVAGLAGVYSLKRLSERLGDLEGTLIREVHLSWRFSFYHNAKGDRQIMLVL